MTNIRRVNITFTFNEAKVDDEDLVERLDELLRESFDDCDNVHTRWVSDLADSPLFGAAQEPPPDAEAER